eukprot:7434462-Karenia_brevis.AAC.1
MQILMLRDSTPLSGLNFGAKNRLAWMVPMTVLQKTLADCSDGSQVDGNMLWAQGFPSFIDGVSNDRRALTYSTVAKGGPPEGD